MASVSCQFSVVFFFAVGTCGVFASAAGRGTGGVFGGGTFCEFASGGVCRGGTF